MEANNQTKEIKNLNPVSEFLDLDLTIWEAKLIANLFLAEEQKVSEILDVLTPSFAQKVNKLLIVLKNFDPAVARMICEEMIMRTEQGITA